MNDAELRVLYETVRIHPIIRQIINRECHVGFSNRRVIKTVISHLKHKHRTFKAMPKKDRKEFLAACLMVHAENWQLYKEVMRGR